MLNQGLVESNVESQLIIQIATIPIAWQTLANDQFNLIILPVIMYRSPTEYQYISFRFPISSLLR